VTRHNVAEDIIESFMVAANVAMAKFLKEKSSLSIRPRGEDAEALGPYPGHRITNLV